MRRRAASRSSRWRKLCGWRRPTITYGSLPTASPSLRRDYAHPRCCRHVSTFGQRSSLRIHQAHIINMCGRVAVQAAVRTANSRGSRSMTAAKSRQSPKLPRPDSAPVCLVVVVPPSPADRHGDLPTAPVQRYRDGINLYYTWIFPKTRRRRAAQVKARANLPADAALWLRRAGPAECAWQPA